MSLPRSQINVCGNTVGGFSTRWRIKRFAERRRPAAGGKTIKDGMGSKGRGEFRDRKPKPMWWIRTLSSIERKIMFRRNVSSNRCRPCRSDTDITLLTALAATGTREQKIFISDKVPTIRQHPRTS